MSEAVVERVLPVEPQALWDVLSDTSRMLRLDPMLESYEPENGALEEGTLNRATSRLGPLRLRMTTRTEVLEPPFRAVFVSVTPKRPARIRVEDTLTSVEGGTSYAIRISVEPVGVAGRLLAPSLARFMARSRRQMVERLAADLRQ